MNVAAKQSACLYDVEFTLICTAAIEFISHKHVIKFWCCTPFAPCLELRHDIFDALTLTPSGQEWTW